jgi:phage-related baseplate assembly protein
MEDMAARHRVNEAPCDLMVAGEKFASRSFGMAVSKRMQQDVSDALHQGIMELHDMVSYPPCTYLGNG